MAVTAESRNATGHYAALVHPDQYCSTGPDTGVQLPRRRGWTPGRFLDHDAARVPRSRVDFERPGAGMRMDGPHINLVDPRLYAHGDPFAQWRWLRGNDPVHRHAATEFPPFWALTRYDDIRDAYRDAATFS